MSLCNLIYELLGNDWFSTCRRLHITPKVRGKMDLGKNYSVFKVSDLIR